MAMGPFNAGSGITAVDATLSKSGSAADAKVTGDKFIALADVTLPKETEEVIMPEETMPFVVMDSTDAAAVFPGGPRLNLRKDETYTAVFDGVPYNCNCFEFAATDGSGKGRVIGNLALYDLNAENTGEPFCLGDRYTLNNGVETFYASVFMCAFEDLPSNSSVSHTIGITKKVNTLSRYVPDKTSEVLMPAQTIKFVYDVDSGNVIANFNTPFKFESGEIYNVTIDGVTYQRAAGEVKPTSDRKWLYVGDSAMIVYGSGKFMCTNIYQCKGTTELHLSSSIYIPRTDTTSETEFHTISISKVVDTLSHLSQYAPFTPHEQSEIIIPEQTLTFTSEMGGQPCHELSASIDQAIGLQVGKTYRVAFDGTEYDCKCKGDVSNGIEKYWVGNLGITGLGADTGEPFILIDAYNIVNNGAATCFQSIIMIFSAISQVEARHTVSIKRLDTLYPYIPYETTEALLPTKTTEFTNNQLARSDALAWATSSPIGFMPGEICKVSVDGVIYQHSVQSVSLDGISGLYVGNLGLVNYPGLSVDDTGEPFAFADTYDKNGKFSGTLLIIQRKDAANTTEYHTVGVSRKATTLDQFYTKKEMDAMLGSYINDVDALLGVDDSVLEGGGA